MRLGDLDFGMLFIREGLYFKKFEGTSVQMLATHEFIEMAAMTEIIPVNSYVIIAHDANGFATIHALLLGSQDPQELFEAWWAKHVIAVIGSPPTGGDTSKFIEWRSRKAKLLKELIDGHGSFQNLIVQWLVREHKFLLLPHTELNFSQGF